MTTEPPSVQVQFTPEFKRSLRTLSKKYRHIRSDVQPVIEQLQAGEFVGDQIPRTRYVVFKIRNKNSDIQKGKSAGYRLIYPPDLLCQNTYKGYFSHHLFKS